MLWYFVVLEDSAVKQMGQKKLQFAYSPKTSAALAYSNVLNHWWTAEPFSE